LTFGKIKTFIILTLLALCLLIVSIAISACRTGSDPEPEDTSDVIVSTDSEISQNVTTTVTDITITDPVVSSSADDKTDPPPTPGTPISETSKPDTPPIAPVEDFKADIPTSLKAKMTTDKMLSSAYLLYDASNNELLYSSDLNGKIYPSGTTRMLTALVALSYLDENAKITVGDELSLLGYGADRVGLVRGDSMTLRRAIEAMLLSTGNDAAYAVSVTVGRKILGNSSASASSASSAFVKQMNSYAKSIGMKASNFVNPDGYPNSSQYTTVYDMLVLTAEALGNDVIRNISSERSVSAQLENGKTVRWTNRNLLLDPLSRFYRSEARGLSVGDSKASGYCLASAACKDGKWLIALIYGADSSDIRYSDASLLYDLGFDGVAPEGSDENVWIVRCNESISLRSDASFSASSVKSVKNGEKVILHGFKNRFAYVTYEFKDSSGKVTKSYRGYALSAYIVRPEEYSYLKDLDVVTPANPYSYEQMNSDLKKLSAKYPDMLELSSIGKSEQGRDLVLAVMGDKNAKYSVFVCASIHAREYMVTELVMAQIDYMLSHQKSEYANSGKTIGEILKETRFYIVPMANPDGVTICQTGVLPDQFKGKYSSFDIQNWKANANGIDLNANFDALWENYSDKYTEPGPIGYKGEYPECAAETRAIAEYLRSMDFDITLSYHSTGSVVFWEFGDNSELNALNRDYASRLCNFYGFTFYNQEDTSTAGLKDYAIHKLGIVSLTVEFGTYDNPLMLSEFHNIWERSRDLLLLSAVWLSEGDG